jgi:pilus assembly protein CpaE
MSPQRMNRVLVVENNAQATKTFRKLLSLIENVEVIDFLTTAQEALEMMNEIKPDVMLIEEHLPDIDGINFTEIIRRDFPATQVIIVSQDKQYDTVLRALRNGASDFLAHDVSISEFREAILRAAEMASIERTKFHPYFAQDTTAKPEEGQNASKAHVISVYSPRGGNGVTTIANNLALAFRDNESQIALIDTVLQFGDLDILFNEVGQLSIMDLAQIAYDLDPKVVKEVMLLHRSSGLNLLAPPKNPVMQEAVSGEQISRVIEYVRNFYDYLVLNTCSYINDATLAALDCSELIVVVVTQEIASIKSLRTFLQLWEGYGMKRERLVLVLNKYRKSSALTPKKISETLNQAIDLSIPEDWETATRAANLGNPLLMSNPNADVSQAIVELADRIKERLPTIANQERFRLYLKNA